MSRKSPVYGIAFEIAGPFGMFADFASGSDPKSYPMPTQSSCVGIIQSIIRIMGVDITIVAVGSCGLPRWLSYKYNSHSPHRVSSSVRAGNCLPMHESVLVNPRLHILATLTNSEKRQGVPEKYRAINCAHSMQEQFYKRLRRGQSFHSVCLGRKEFLADYIGLQHSPIETSFNTVIPVMSSRFFLDGKPNLDYLTNVEIKQGVLHFEKSVGVSISDQGALRFKDDNLHHQTCNRETRRAQRA